jgi:hypothetical protein
VVPISHHNFFRNNNCVTKLNKLTSKNSTISPFANKMDGEITPGDGGGGSSSTTIVAENTTNQVHPPLNVRSKSTSNDNDDDHDRHHYHDHDHRCGKKLNSPAAASAAAVPKTTSSDDDDCNRRISALEERSKEIREEVLASMSPRAREEHERKKSRTKKCVGCAEGCADCCGSCECVIL